MLALINRLRMELVRVRSCHRIVSKSAGGRNDYSWREFCGRKLVCLQPCPGHRNLPSLRHRHEIHLPQCRAIWMAEASEARPQTVSGSAHEPTFRGRGLPRPREAAINPAARGLGRPLSRMSQGNGDKGIGD